MTDLLRYFALCEIAFAIGFTAAMMVSREQYRRAREQLGALAYVHVLGAGSAFILLALGTASEITLKLGTEATWRTALAVTAATIAAATQGWTYVLWRRPSPNPDRAPAR